MIESHDYKVSLAGTGPKTATLSAPDLTTALDISSPPEFGGPEGLWSPEHLYVASLSSCLMTTFQAIAAASGVDVLAYADRASGHLQRGEDRLYSMDSVTLRPDIEVPSAQLEKAGRLLDKAERACLISRSVKSEIILEPNLHGS